jgi:hypothetical protein
MVKWQAGSSMPTVFKDPTECEKLILAVVLETSQGSLERRGQPCSRIAGVLMDWRRLSKIPRSRFVGQKAVFFFSMSYNRCFYAS